MRTFGNRGVYALWVLDEERVVNVAEKVSFPEGVEVEWVEAGDRSEETLPKRSWHRWVRTVGVEPLPDACRGRVATAQGGDEARCRSTERPVA